MRTFLPMICVTLLGTAPAFAQVHVEVVAPPPPRVVVTAPPPPRVDVAGAADGRFEAPPPLTVVAAGRAGGA